MDKEYKAALIRAAITIIACIAISLIPDPIPIVDEIIIMLFGSRSAMNAIVAAEAIKAATKGKVNIDKETIDRVANSNIHQKSTIKGTMDIFADGRGDGHNGN